MLCALMYRQNGALANMIKSTRKKSAPECPFECAGGVQSLNGQCPNAFGIFFGGASLTGGDQSDLILKITQLRLLADCLRGMQLEELWTLPPYHHVRNIIGQNM